jgi:hypothetical protein
VRGFLKHFAPDELRPDEISILEDALEDAWRRDAKWLADSAVLYLSQQKLTHEPADDI